MVQSAKPYILGIDLGVQSVGWAVIDLDVDGWPCGVRRAGVRCFDSGVGSETKISAGKDESGNTKRRQARLQRRQLWRRGRRLNKVFNLLRKAGLLPAGEARTPQQRHELLYELDAELAKTHIPDRDRVAGHLLPYSLRALALDQPLPPFAFGRALFHLAQRRGFLSNRKSVGKSDEEEGKVKAGIVELQQKIEQCGARTLGEYFAGLDPEQEPIRNRWTARQMYLEEFEEIWAAQAPHHPTLTDEWKQRIHQAVFHQRPLKSQRHRIGMCELEPDHRRAPRGCLENQRFRYIQKVNDLEIQTPDGEIWGLNEPAHADLRAKLIELLETHAEIAFKSMRSKLRLKKPKGSEADYLFNLEAGGEKKIKGNATNAKLLKVLGHEYGELSPDQLSAVVDDLIEYENRDALARRLTARYGISPEKAEDLADLTLEDGYASLSREAIQQLLPWMQEGMRFAAAKKQVYGEYRGGQKVYDSLPPVLEAVPQLRNPVVCRGLTELRRAANAIIREYGKPETVRVELARDLKRSRQQREDITKKNRQNEKARDEAREEIRAKTELGIAEPRRSDILKVLLANECNWGCPYTGKPICMGTLLGPHPQFDIEHIIPFSRSLDNSFMNKTLCDIPFNRDVKQNRTPHEAFSANEQQWHEMIARVKRFRGSAAYGKLRKFQQEQLDDDWATRQLQDTRYMSKLAAEYVGLLFGGQIDAHHTRRVQVSAGGVTAYLRDEWGLNAILNDGGDEKNREDHRHHAVDAVVIALTSPATVKALSDSAELARQRGHRLFTPIEKPWSTLLDDTRNAIEAVNISYRVNRRVSGALHDETYYSKAHQSRDASGKKEVEYRHFRKPLHKMSAQEVKNIVDDTIRGLVNAKLEQIGGEPKKVFADLGNHPYLATGDGRRIFIHKARVKKRLTVVRLGSADSPRYVAPGSNHHMEIYAVLDKVGNETRWEAKTVTLMEAAARVRAREKKPVVQRDHGPGTKFKFSLAGGEYLELDGDNGQRRLVRVTVISGKKVEYRLHNDARPITLLRQVEGGRAGLSLSADSLRKANARKVAIDPLGNVFPAND
ncbi:MAG TPA: type II CRISPR RNA-guided endonuclease Cas9 [Thermoguttaceae bacterium]|nr:type II CRISPR RNA-guided endonuclease Cas9 [Thermoguttaceae bacterium]